MFDFDEIEVRHAARCRNLFGEVFLQEKRHCYCRGGRGGGGRSRGPTLIATNFASGYRES